MSATKSWKSEKSGNTPNDNARAIIFFMSIWWFGWTFLSFHTIPMFCVNSVLFFVCRIRWAKNNWKMSSMRSHAPCHWNWCFFLSFTSSSSPQFFSLLLLFFFLVRVSIFIFERTFCFPSCFEFRSFGSFCSLLCLAAHAYKYKNVRSLDYIAS